MQGDPCSPCECAGIGIALGVVGCMFYGNFFLFCCGVVFLFVFMLPSGLEKNGVAFLSSSSFFYRVDLGIHIFYLCTRTNHEVLGGNYTLLW